MQDTLGYVGDHVAYAPAAFSLIWNERGQPVSYAFANGTFRYCQQGPRCMFPVLPLMWFAYARPNLQAVGSWHGTLLADKQDASGTHYRRNRYYDPQSGRFTQEDPIGLAGGLNLYGFAGGDPVNFSDSFGLSPDTVPKALREKIGDDLCIAANCDNVNIVTSGPVADLLKVVGGSAVTLGTTIFFPQGLDPNSVGDVAWLAHELVHVVQYRSLGSETYYNLGVKDVLKNAFGNPYEWRALAQSGRSWNKWNMEAQAEVVRSCFVGDLSACSHSPFQPPRR